MSKREIARAGTAPPAVPRPLRLLSLLANLRRRQAAIRGIQERKLRALVAYASANVPFYHELYRKAGIEPGSIRGLADLARLPLVSKSDLLGRPPADLLGAGIRPAECASFSSSGTSGFPLTVYWHARDRAVMNLGWKRAFLACGMGPRDRTVAFSGRRPAERPSSWHERLGFFPRLEISSWLAPQQWLDLLRAARPQVISGYVMTLRLLAEFLSENHVQDVRPRLLFQTSALLDESSRRLFSRVFASRVFDIYGSEEAGCIAWECPACAGYHVAADMLIVEVLKDGRPARPGEQGEVVVTNLHSRSMPFIRYRQGDMVTVADDLPRCGNPFPLITRIEGRMEDFLVLRDGRRMPLHPVYHCIDPVPGVKRWRITQETAGRLRLEIAAGDDLSPQSLRRIVDDIAALTREQMEVEIAVVGAIPVSPGAKFRAITSSVGKPPLP